MLGFDALGRLALGQLDNVTERSVVAEVCTIIVTVVDADLISEPPEARRPLYRQGQSYWKGRS